ncbi:MAG: tRNA glutamyl-Q(34) synthetase GluQRS [Thiohalomonadaceae bacterium]
MYVGRFAPSPTGPLHFGSLVAATGSFLRARAMGGRWLVRVEDIDPPREVPGAADAILRALEAFGLEWDGPVLYQSSRLDAYREALDALLTGGLAFACTCSRKDIAQLAGPSGVYPGTCRRRRGLPRAAHAIRVAVGETVVEFDDLLQGPQRQDLAREVGDFVVRRADGLFAYQLAVVVDDAFQGVTEVVRGADLLDSTPRQIHLQRLLGLPTPGYLHLPVAVDAAGQKLSKQTHAAPLDPARPLPAIAQALRFLGLAPGPELLEADPAAAWAWAIARFRLDHLPRRCTLPV